MIAVSLIPHNFLSPGRLWLLAAVGLLALAYAGTLVQQRQYTVRFTNVALLDTVAPRRPGWRRHIAALALLGALAALVLAYARPSDTVLVPRERATVVLAIDTSLSMEATDVDPSRIEAAKVAALNFVDRLPPKINLGLVTFDGIARVRATPTVDRDAVRRVINSLELHEATAIGEAIYASLDALHDVPANQDPDQEPPPSRIVLMTDGKTTIGRPDLDGAQAAEKAKVEVSTIAFGTEHGVIRINGELQPVPVAEAPLRDIAQTTHGQFFRAESLEELEKVYTNIGSAVGYEKEQQEVTERFTGIALLLFVVSAGLSLLWFNRLP